MNLYYKKEQPQHATTTKHKRKHKSPCQSHESGPLAPQSEELPLDQRDN